MSDSSESRAQGAPLWQAKTLWVAAGLTLIGLILWIATPATSAPKNSSPGEASLAEASGEAVASKVHSVQGTPALFRFGASYLAGFFLGYGLRRFLRFTLIASVVLFGGLYLMKHQGWLDLNLDWAGIERQLSDSFGWLRGQAEAFKQFLTGYVPSAAAAGVGLFLGARWR